MPATTPLGIPYPLGTDRVADGDNAIQSLANWVDASIAFGAGQVAATGPGAGSLMWFNNVPIAAVGGVTAAGTFPVLGFRVPRKGWYDLRAVANMQVGSSAAGASAQLFIGDGATGYCYGQVYFTTINADHAVSCGTVIQLAAGAMVYWGMQSNGPQAAAIMGGPTKNCLTVRLLLPLP